MFARTHVNKKPNGVRSCTAMQKEMMVKQRQVHGHIHFCNYGDRNSLFLNLVFGSFGEIMGDEAWHSDNTLSVSTSLKYD